MTDPLSPTQTPHGSAEHRRMLHILSLAHCQELHTLFQLQISSLIYLTICKMKCAVTTVLLDCVMERDTSCSRSCLYCQVSTVSSRPDLAGAYSIYTVEALHFHLWLFTSYVTG